MLSDEQLNHLRENGVMGADLSPGDELSLLAYNEIRQLRQSLVEAERERDEAKERARNAEANFEAVMEAKCAKCHRSLAPNGGCLCERVRLLEAVREAAEKIRHWHDTSYNPATGETEGMVVSADSVRGVWKALAAAKEPTK